MFLKIMAVLLFLFGCFCALTPSINLFTSFVMMSSGVLLFSLLQDPPENCEYTPFKPKLILDDVIVCENNTVSTKELPPHLGRLHPDVGIIHNIENGCGLYVVVPVTDPSFWIDTFDTYNQAVGFCDKHNMNIVLTNDIE